jgi:hypothetical protein
MQDTRAIRPEIKGLFETIKVQAIQYAESFDRLEKCQSDFESLSQEIKTINNDLYVSINNELLHFKQYYNYIIKLLKIENNKVTQKYTELKDLKQLQDSYFEANDSILNINQSLEKQFNELKSYFTEYQKIVDSIKIAADEKVEEYISNSTDKIEKTVKASYSKFEDRVASKVRQIESKIISYDELNLNFQEKYKSEHKKILDEIDNFKRVIVNIELTRENPKDPNSPKYLINELNDRVIRFEDNFREINERIDSFYKLMKPNNFQPSSYEPVPASKTKQFNNEDLAIINRLNNQISELSKKQSTFLGIGVSGIILAVIAIVLAFIF